MNEHEGTVNHPELSRRLRLTITAIVVAGVASTVGLGFFGSQSHLSDFTGYFTASRIVTRGDSIASMYNDAWFREQVKSVSTRDTNMLMYVNPPGISLVMIPLANLDPYRAKVFWNLLSLVLAGGIWYLGREMFGIRARPGYGMLFLGMLVVTIPFLRNLQRGQIYVLMLFLVLLFWKGLNDRKPWLAGCSLAMLLLLKYFGWMFIPLLIVERRWKELVFTLGTLVVGTGILLMVLGIEAYQSHIERLFASFRSMDVAVTGLPSIPALIGALVLSSPWLSTLRFFPSEVWIWIITVTLLLAMIYFTFRSTRAALPESQSRGFLAILMLSVLFTPLAAEHHYVLLVFPLWFMLSDLLQRGVSWTMFPAFGLLSYAIFGWLPASVSPGGHSLSFVFPYLRLLAATMLWLMVVTYRERRGVPA